ncbi:MAG TPA: dTDP-glucose 4,6-dehydratase [Rubricoccaceae bacterium]|nr:dTDP-glucose 4,6-dehydratase [Rubricoccaceae bacterium]
MANFAALMENVLVTGGAGFIGANFVRWLLREAPAARVVTLDALTYAGSLRNLEGLPDPARHAFVHGEVQDGPLVERLLREHDVDTVVHFAAETHVDRSILGPRRFVETNVVGTFTLLEAARQAWRGRRDVRFHHVSTDEVYGSLAPGEPAFTEATPYDPNSPYSASKAGSDHLVRAYARTYGLPVTITNCSNNYGPYQFPEKLLPLMLLNALSGRPLPIYGDGRQVRDWLYVEDHCDAIGRVLAAGEPGETYNVGGNNQVANLDLVHRLCDLLDRRFPESPHAPHAGLIRFVEDRPGHDRRYAMDTKKIERDLGWTPEETLETGLEQTVDWYLAHADWLDAVAEEKGLAAWWEENYAGRLGSVNGGR